MPTINAAVSDEDIRRSYYQSVTNPKLWITELDLDPLTLVVCDSGSGKYFRVPVSMAEQGGAFFFGEPTEVPAQEVQALAAAPNSIVWASEAESRAGIEVTLPGTGQVDYEAIAQMAGPVTGEDQALGIAALQAGEPLTAGQAAALIHAAAVRAQERTNTPAADSATGPSHTEGAVMPFDRDKIREALGLGPDATDEQLQQAWTAAFAAPGTPPATTPPAAPGSTALSVGTPPAVGASPAGTPPPAGTGDENMSRLATMAKAMGVTLIDPYQLQAMQNMAAQGQLAYQKQRADERDTIIDKSIDEGRIELARKKFWQDKWDADPEGTRETLAALQPNLIPMSAQGYAGTVASNEAESRLFDLYPEMKPQGGGRRG